MGGSQPSWKRGSEVAADLFGVTGGGVRNGCGVVEVGYSNPESYQLGS